MPKPRPDAGQVLSVRLSLRVPASLRPRANSARPAAVWPTTVRLLPFAGHQGRVPWLATHGPGMREILQRIIRDGRISTFVMNEFYQLVLARSIDAHAGHIGDLARRLCGAAHVDQSSAGPDGAFSPPTGSPYHSALVIRDGEAFYAIGVEWRGKPDPKLDAIIAKALGRPTSADLPKGPDYSAIRAVRAFRIDQAGGLEQVLDDIVEDTWRSSMLVSVTASYANLVDNNRTWTDGVSRLNAAGVDHWRGFFAALRRVLIADSAERVVTDAAAYGARAFSNAHDADLEDYVAVREFAGEVAKVDGFLPSAAAAALASNLEAFKAENDLSYLLSRGYLLQIHDACRSSGHVDKEAEFDFSDLNDGVYVRASDESISLFLHDQNRRMRIDLQREGEVIRSISVSSCPRLRDMDLQHLASFSVSPEGVAAITDGELIEGDDIRAWNSFVVCVESAALSLDLEYAPGSLTP
jgi:hypothetical protein